MSESGVFLIRNHDDHTPQEIGAFTHSRHVPLCTFPFATCSPHKTVI